MSAGMLAMAVVPTIILVVFLYAKDPSKKKPHGFLASLFLWGVLSCIIPALVEPGLEPVLISLVGEESVEFHALYAFLVVALSEEGDKYLVLKRKTWNAPQFCRLHDAITFAVMVSLGFATIENVFYLCSGEISTAIARALLSVPGHAVDALFMGYFYGLAKLADAHGDTRRAARLRRMSLAMAILTHGTYDFFVFVQSGIGVLCLLVFVVITYVKGYQLVKHVYGLNLTLPRSEAAGWEGVSTSTAMPAAELP